MHKNNKTNPSKELNDIQGKTDIRYYFRRLRVRLTIGILAAFIIPYSILLIYLHVPFNNSVTNIGKLNLEAISKSQSNTIDLFLQERVGNLCSLFYSKDFIYAASDDKISDTSKNSNQLNKLPDNIKTFEKIWHYLESLRRVNDSFIDVGLFDKSGIQKKYAGPFSFLQHKNYSNEKWFKELIKTENNYYISDIYLGFRNKPHFTIAVKHNINSEINIIRATIDPEKFYLYLRSITQNKKIDSFIVNNNRIYQVVDPEKGKFLDVSEYIPPLDKKVGADIITVNAEKFFVGYSWLKYVPWALVVKQPINSVKSSMYKARNLIIGSFALLLIIMSFLIWFTTKKLIGKARDNAEKKDELWEQLRHASKLASVGELATGVAHEINNPLAIIIATSGVIQDMFNPEFNLNPTNEEILKELKIINVAAFRAKGITQQLLDYGRKNKPMNKSSNINNLINSTIGKLQYREFNLEGVKIEKKYEENLPEIFIDQDQLRQVILNIVNNAKDAISGSGKITISTKKDAENIYITITDTGFGMSLKEMSKIFDPFFTTKDAGKGTGLGLSVSLNIIKSMGGDISVQSIEDRGSSFTILLPIDNNKGDNNER
jgi:two-component system, NtrC family, sensor kinase